MSWITELLYSQMKGQRMKVSQVVQLTVVNFRGEFKKLNNVCAIFPDAVDPRIFGLIGAGEVDKYFESC